jgi:hypothetical protein
MLYLALKYICFLILVFCGTEYGTKNLRARQALYLLPISPEPLILCFQGDNSGGIGGTCYI